ncbi:hypothetical protein MKX07_005652 [Trichoderma sp. CBMAI-0711]|uniref:Myb-like DNA-binding domain-containing protein n=2 Tax=Trichoderma TaxID=5543 RepID=A0A2H2ZK84_TRIPA|nr:hypothetical protein MKX07_005652 [Trichoderma sp. CBMAI-0711]OTA07223.1 hypothetical protein A9Z42_0081080 [Trichoderma parareesei]
MADETPKQRPQPTASEAMFFFAIVKHTKNRADIDWHAVAEEQGFKNAEVAKVRFGQVRRKLGIESNTTPKKGGGNTSSAASTPSKVRKTPTGRTGTKGKGRSGGKAKKEAKAEPDVDDDDDGTIDGDESSPIKEEDAIRFKTEHEDPFSL